MTVHLNGENPSWVCIPVSAGMGDTGKAEARRERCATPFGRGDYA